MSSTLIIGGIAVAATGTVVQFARAAVGPQMLAMVGGPQPAPDISAWTGAAIALSGAVTAIFAAVSKVLIDAMARYKAASLEADKARDAAELETERAHAAQELEAEKLRAAQKIQEAQAQAKVDQDRLQALVEQIGEMAATIGALRSELAEAKRVVEHTDRNVKHNASMGSQLATRLVDKVVDKVQEAADAAKSTNRKVTRVAEALSGSGVDISVDDSDPDAPTIPE